MENETTTTPAADRKRAPVRKRRVADEDAESKAAKLKKISKASTVSNTSVSKRDAVTKESSNERRESGSSKKAYYPEIAFDTNKITSF